MPRVNISVLINVLRQRQQNIYQLYLDTHDLGMSDALLNESIAIGQIIEQLRIVLES
jgi:hypothetical protein